MSASAPSGPSGPPTRAASPSRLARWIGARTGNVPPPVRPQGVFRYRDDEEIEKPFNWAQMRRLLSYMGPHRRVAAMASAATLLGAAMQLARPFLWILAVDNAIDNRRLGARAIGALDLYAALYLVSFLVSWAASTAQVRLTNRLGQSVLVDLRRHLYSHIQGLSLTFFDRRPAGNILVRVTNDVNSLGDLFTNGIVSLLTNVFMLAGVIAVMLSLKWNLALACFAILPGMVALSTGMRRRIRKGWQRVRVRLSRINAHLNEAIQGIRVTQAFVREPLNHRFFNAINYEYYQQWLTTVRSSSMFSPLVTLTGAIGTAIAFWYGATLVQSGAVQIGIIVGFLQYMTLFWQPISQIGMLYNSLLSAMASSERIFQFLDFRPDVESPVEAPALAQVRGEVVFDHVGFRYGSGPEVLSDVSFRIEPGQTVALVGHTGAGKTTVVSLLARFYDPTAGAIRIDGHDLREVSLASLRSQIGMVIQETFLFSGTIGTNLKYGRLAATLREIEAAAGEAGMHPFIRSLPQGYDTEVQERGGRLSGGQRQLLAIARALLADPRVLILDEATSSIDTHTEVLVQAALARLLQGRTSFVVAHRLSTIRRADRILVFDHGRIVESGNHESLLARDGVYAGLLRAQFRFLDDLGEAGEAGGAAG